MVKTRVEHVISPGGERLMNHADRRGISDGGGGRAFLPLAGGVMSGDIDPAAANSFELGTLAKYWSNVFTDDLVVNKISQRSAGIIMANDVLPEGDNSLDLGSSSKKWAALFVTGTTGIDNLTSASAQDHVTVQDDLDPQAAGTYDLGDSTLYWQNGYIDDIFCDTLDDRSGGGIEIKGKLFSTGANNLGDATNYFGNIYVQNLQAPSSTGYISIGNNLNGGLSHLSLGDATRYFGNVYTGDLFSDDIQALAGAIVDLDDDLSPKTDNTYDLGSASYRYAEIWALDIICSNIQTNGFVEFDEIADGGAPSVTEARLWIKNNGSNKQELIITWEDNVDLIIATQS